MFLMAAVTVVLDMSQEENKQNFDSMRGIETLTMVRDRAWWLNPAYRHPAPPRNETISHPLTDLSRICIYRKASVSDSLDSDPV